MWASLCSCSSSPSWQDCNETFGGGSSIWWTTTAICLLPFLPETRLNLYHPHQNIGHIIIIILPTALNFATIQCCVLWIFKLQCWERHRNLFWAHPDVHLHLYYNTAEWTEREERDLRISHTQTSDILVSLLQSNIRKTYWVFLFTAYIAQHPMWPCGERQEGRGEERRERSYCGQTENSTFKKENERKILNICHIVTVSYYLLCFFEYFYLVCQ